MGLENITLNQASGGDGIPAELLKIIKDDAVNVLQCNVPTNWENSSMETGQRKGQFSFQSQGKAKPNTIQILYDCTHFTF